MSDQQRQDVSPPLTQSSVAAPGRSSRPQEPSRGLGWLFLLVPFACCGGPLVIAVAAAGAWALGGIAGGLLALAIAAVLIVRSRRRRACCVPSGTYPSDMSRPPGTPG
jgi:hypothetical protein